VNSKTIQGEILDNVGLSEGNFMVWMVLELLLFAEVEYV